MTKPSPTPRIPSVGDDPRDHSQVAELPGKTLFRDLDEAVIEADRCIQCGTCVSVCPSDSIGIDELEHRPTLVRMCTGCSRCWDFCPRTGLRYERLLHLETESRPDTIGGTYAARAKAADLRSRGQDSGAVTALLAALLEAGALDGALVATETADLPLKGEATLATTRAELVAAAGSKYNQTMQLGSLEHLIAAAGLDPPDSDIAIVGTPCVIQGAAALERYEWTDEASPIALTIALMCTRNFEYHCLRSRLEAHGVDPTAVDRIDVSAGMLSVIDETGSVVLEDPVEAFDGAALYGCGECADFLGEAADITAGSIGSADGYTTFIVRSARGDAAWSAATDALEVRELDEPAAIDRVASWNDRRARAALPREFDPAGRLSISYEAHREAYDGTARAPQPLNPARVYQYEEWC